MHSGMQVATYMLQRSTWLCVHAMIGQYYCVHVWVPLFAASALVLRTGLAKLD